MFCNKRSQAKVSTVNFSVGSTYIDIIYTSVAIHGIPIGSQTVSQFSSSSPSQYLVLTVALGY